MAIIDVEQSRVEGSKGIERTIDDGAIKLVLDTIQITQYTKPEESTVRELTSNAVDAQKEKEKAIDILTGKAKVEDYYITRGGDKYKDSNFDKEYYDLNALDRANNHVELTYKEGKDGVGYCDSFHIKDFGCGIGGKRLEGYFKIGYSTKRNSTSQLGGFGFGAKVALSMRNDYYTMITVHNGKRFKFNCYSYKVDNMIGKFNLETGQLNPHIVFSDGSTQYYEETTDKNHTEIIVPCKKHHREKFKQAVRSQLLYFDNVKFYVVRETGGKEEVNFKAKVMYNSKHIIISDNYQFSKPHIIIVKDNDQSSTTGVCYGYVNFQELELEDIMGNIGLKCPIRSVVVDDNGVETVLQEGVEVTPSREAVIWSERTREFIKQRFANVVEEATELIQKELVEKDLLVWLNKVTQVINGYGNNSSTLSRMRSVIDMNSVSPKFIEDDRIKHGTAKDFFWGQSLRTIFKSSDYKTGKELVKREEIESWSEFAYDKIYIQRGNTSGTKDAYLLATVGRFMTLRLDEDDKLIDYHTNVKPDEKRKPWTLDKVNNRIEVRNAIFDYIDKSKYSKDYDAVIVPEDWAKKYEEGEKEEEAQAEIAKLTPAELRKLQAKTVVSAVRWDEYRSDGKQFSWDKHEPTIQDLQGDTAEVIYGYGNDELEVQFLAAVLNEQICSFQKVKQPREADYYTNEFKLIRIAEANKKYVKKHTHISKYFSDVTPDNKIVMGQRLVQWNTARIIYNELPKLKFLTNYATFDKAMADLFKEIVEYSTENYKDYTFLSSRNKIGCTPELFEEIIVKFDKMRDMQLYVREHEGKAEAIGNKSTELFGSDVIADAHAIDIGMYDKLQTLLDYAEPVRNLFNHIEVLTKVSTISYETEVLIKEVIDAKGLAPKQVDVAVEELELEPSI